MLLKNNMLTGLTCPLLTYVSVGRNKIIRHLYMMFTLKLNTMTLLECYIIVPATFDRFLTKNLVGNFFVWNTVSALLLESVMGGRDSGCG